MRPPVHLDFNMITINDIPAELSKQADINSVAHASLWTQWINEKKSAATAYCFLKESLATTTSCTTIYLEICRHFPTPSSYEYKMCRCQGCAQPSTRLPALVNGLCAKYVVVYYLTTKHSSDTRIVAFSKATYSVIESQQLHGLKLGYSTPWLNYNSSTPSESPKSGKDSICT